MLGLMVEQGMEATASVHGRDLDSPEKGYIHVAVTGYESRGSGKDEHVVWLLCVTRGDGDGGSIQEVLARRYSKIHQFNAHLLKLQCTPAAFQSAGGKWTKKVQKTW